MAIRYSDTPQLDYSGRQQLDDPYRRFPSHARPINTANTTSGSDFWVYEPSGQKYRGAHHLGQWIKTVTERDPYSGAVRTRMTGEVICNPVMVST